MSEPTRSTKKPCGWDRDGESCEKNAVQHKDYCARHLMALSREEREQDREVLGASEEELEEAFAPDEEEEERDEPVQRPNLPRPRRPRPPEPERPVDPELLAGKMAAILVARDAAQRLAVAKGQMPRDAKGHRVDPDEEQDRSFKVPRLNFQVRQRRPRRDITRMTDPETGQNLITPGWVARWVREIDGEGRPSQARVEEFKDYGYEVVMSRDGKPLRSALGVAMTAPPEQYAERIKDYMPTGALNRDDLLADAYEAVEEANQHAGDEVVKIAVGRGHGRRKSYRANDTDGPSDF